MRSIASAIVVLSVLAFSGACENRYTLEPTVTLTVSPFGEGTVSDDAGFFCSGANTCSEQFPPGTVLDLSAAGEGGYDFRAWSGCDQVDGATCSVALDADRVVFPTFGKTLTRNPRAFVLTSADLAALVAVVGPELNEEFTFGSDAPTIPQLVVGDRIASPFEVSFVRLVTSVTPAANGEIVIATELATLEDVFDEGTLSFSGQLTSVDAGTLPPGVLMMGFDPAGTFTLEIEQEIADGVSIVGALRQDFFLDVAVDYRWYSGLREVRAALKTEATNELLLKIEGNVSVDAKYEFPPISLGEYLVHGVLLSPRIVLEVGAKGSAESSMSAGVEYEIDTVTGFHYRRDADPQWETISTLSQDLSPVWEPEPLTISVKGYAKAKLEVLVYKVAGPYFAVEGHTRAVVAPWDDPWWSVYAGFEAGVGLHVEVPVLGTTVADWSAPLYKREWLLAAATATARPMPSVSPQLTVSPTSGPQGTTFNYSGTGFTPNGGITKHVQKPDGTEYPTTALTASGGGQATDSYVSSSTTVTGTYYIWWIDNTTGLSTSHVAEAITASGNPQLTVSPTSGPQGTTFNYSGTGFAPNGGITKHVQKPDGTEYPTTALTANGSGQATDSYVSSSTTVTGTYYIWWIDNTTGLSTSHVAETITASVSPELTVSPASGPRGTTFNYNGTGFTPNGGITKHVQKPDGTEYPTTALTANGSGQATDSYVSSSTTVTGTYYIWWIDNTTGLSTSHVAETITP